MVLSLLFSSGASSMDRRDVAGIAWWSARRDWRRTKVGFVFFFFFFFVGSRPSSTPRLGPWRLSGWAIGLRLGVL